MLVRIQLSPPISLVAPTDLGVMALMIRSLSGQGSNPCGGTKFKDQFRNSHKLSPFDRNGGVRIPSTKNLLRVSMAAVNV